MHLVTINFICGYLLLKVFETVWHIRVIWQTHLESFYLVCVVNVRCVIFILRGVKEFGCICKLVLNIWEKHVTQLIIPSLSKHFLHLGLGILLHSWPLLDPLLVPLPFPKFKFKCLELSLGRIFPPLPNLNPPHGFKHHRSTDGSRMHVSGWISVLNSRLGSSSAPWHLSLASKPLELYLSKSNSWFIAATTPSHPNDLFLSGQSHLRNQQLFLLVAQARSLVIVQDSSTCQIHLVYLSIHLVLLPNKLEEDMATYSSILAWKIPWTEEPGRRESMKSPRIGHEWAHIHTK